MIAKRISRKRHQIWEPTPLDQELISLPSPPADLPKPWNWTRWINSFRFGFFVSLFGLWSLGNLLNIQVISLFQGSCAVSLGLFLFLGLYLINRFQLRGYRENYSKQANKALHQSLKRYRRPIFNENFIQIFPRYIIDSQEYYLVWYVPGAGTVFSTSLKPGSEPLIFNDQGKWLDDNVLFSKMSLMWMYALDFAPRSFQRKQITSANQLQKQLPRTMASLPHLLELNKKNFVDHGLTSELELVKKGYPIMLALYRLAQKNNIKLIQWADAHGWDSLTEIRYEVILELHNGNKKMEMIRDEFKKRYNHAGITEAATKMVLFLTSEEGKSVRWQYRKELDLGLRAMTEGFPNVERHFRFENGRWIPPDDMQKAYDARVAFARQVDQKPDKQK